MWTPAQLVLLAPGDRELLEGLVRARNTAPKVALRARIILGAAEGISNNRLARQLGVTRSTVLLWRERYARAGVAALLRDAPRPGRPNRIAPRQVEAIVNATLNTTPRDAAYWSSRTLARAQGVSAATVRRIWRAHGLQPHWTGTDGLGWDSDSGHKLWDVVGLYFNPPGKALVFCVDEKGQIQAGDRTQPTPPLQSGIPARQTHDDIRHGTTTLFAALNVLEGTLIETYLPRQRHLELLAFLECIERATLHRRDIHMIVLYCGKRTHPKVQGWLAVHPRYRLQFTPLGASWLNLVERWFAEIARTLVPRGTFHRVSALNRAILEYLRGHNYPRPFIWTAPISI
jgi:transposase